MNLAGSSLPDEGRANSFLQPPHSPVNFMNLLNFSYLLGA